MTNIDSIIRALGRLGLEAKQAPTPKLVKESDERKSLMILPFDDLSPTGDNGWFADGIVSELTQVLSNVKSLHVTDAQTTKDFKRYQGTLPMYAKEMRIRYFVEGDVRKFGDQIKVNSRLLDIESGDHLWQDWMKGTMSDIFEIQEAVALKVVEGLKVHLASGEKQKLAARGTDNSEAYELYMKADEYLARQTKEGIGIAIRLSTEAIKLDPGYALAYQLKATALTAFYRGYDRTHALLDEAEMLSKEALRLKSDLFAAYRPLSEIYLHRGQLGEAEAMAKEFIRKDPQNWYSHFTLGFFYYETGQPEKAIAPKEEAVRLNPDNLKSLFSLLVSCDAAGEEEQCAHWSEIAVPQYERYLKLHPDDDSMRVWYALTLFWSGRLEESHAAAMKLTNLKDGALLYNTTTLFIRLDDPSQALRTFCKSIGAGFKETRLLRWFLSDENTLITGLVGTPEYEEAKRMLQETEAEAETKQNG